MVSMEAVIDTRRPAHDRARHVDVVVVGGGQAGLAVGYHLKQQSLSFTILDANERVGDSWRKRWDSLRLFTPARYDGLPELPFPGPGNSFPTKDEVADYLEAYAARFDLPVQTGVRVDALTKNGNRFVLMSGERRFEADNVVVAMATHQVPRVPPFAAELDPGIVQLHAAEYRNPSQLREGGVLVVGTGNSGAEIALDVVSAHPAWLSGREPHAVPFRLDSPATPLFQSVVRFAFQHVLTMKTPMGRKVRPKILSHGAPLVRVKPRDIAAAGIERVPRTVGVSGGRPVLQDQRILDVANVIWCTGFRPDFSWIDLPIFENEIEPRHQRGIVADVPGLYFVGLLFLYAMSSATLPGVGRDAEHVVKDIAARARVARAA